MQNNMATAVVTLIRQLLITGGACTSAARVAIPIRVPFQLSVTQLLTRCVFLVTLVCFGLHYSDAWSAPTEKIRLQLKWYHQFQFAGYYAAQAKGFYTEEGLDVQLFEGSPERPPDRLVQEGKADFGVHDGGDLLYRRLLGEPLVAIATVFQHSPYVLISKKSSGINHPSRLIGRSVEITLEGGDAPILAMFHREGIKIRSRFDTEPVRFMPHSWDFNNLSSGRTDAMSAYLTEIPRIRRLYKLDVSILNPLDYGIDFYGDTLFTSDDFLKKRPDVVERFRRASLKGWKYAMAHQDECIDLVMKLETTRQPKLDRQALVDEAHVMNDLVLPTLVELGNMNPGRWEQMAKAYRELGTVESDRTLDGFIYTVDATDQRTKRLLKMFGIFVAVIVLLSIAGFIWLHQLKLLVRQKTAELRQEIDERKAVEEQLRKFSLIINQSPSNIVITDVNATIEYVNDAFVKNTGYSRDEALGQNPRILRSSNTPVETFVSMWNMLSKGSVWKGELLNRRKDGTEYTEFTVIAPVRQDNGEITHYVAVKEDITASKAAADEINRLAFYDSLTELPNRRLLIDRLQHALLSYSRHRKEGALLLIDLDNFKNINDTLGHDIGDLLLQQVAQRLTESVREGDTVARLGGDEFVVMLENLSANPKTAASQCQLIAESLVLALKRPYDLAGNSCLSTPSIGITLFSAHRETDDLLRQAELAMYEAKSVGRGTIRFFDPEMQSIASTRAILESDLHLAIGKGQFHLHYQSQVSSDGRLTGAEALLRWTHPERGMISPAEFIPLAEETGLILPIGHWVLQTACARLAYWANQKEFSELTLSVNVSARQFKQSNFVDVVLATLDHFGTDPRRLKFELTENMLVEDVEDVIGKMSALKTRGVSFSLDDFGTGYSSLVYLKRLPIDQLKIDQGFVRDILTDPNDAAIAKTIIALAESMGVGVIAEGVEFEPQRDFLARNGCQAFQGYFFGKPIPLVEFEQSVKTSYSPV